MQIIFPNGAPLPLLLGAAAIFAYFCGCFNGAVIVSKYILRNDVRNHGSGNAGLTNFFRTFGGPLTFVRTEHIWRSVTDSYRILRKI